MLHGVEALAPAVLLSGLGILILLPDGFCTRIVWQFSRNAACTICCRCRIVRLVLLWRPLADDVALCCVARFGELSV